MMNFCTLFDSNYLDKGLALYQSLDRVAFNFKIYIFCFDCKCYEVLKKMSLQHAVLIQEEDISFAELEQLKKQRSRAEYCWTCTPIIVEYVLNHFKVPSCTYLDSDLYFFSDPQILFNEIKEVHADAVIVEHRFQKDKNYLENIRKYGKYCVQFNYFKNCNNGKHILNNWKSQCLACCSYNKKDGAMGDQKYLESWTQEFHNVYELQHLGGGVAPWNLKNYRWAKNDFILEDISTGQKFPLIFYHFQNIKYIASKIVNINSRTEDKKLKMEIYIPYLKQLEQNRQFLREEFGVVFTGNKSCSSNKWVAFIQKYIMCYKIKYISDIIKLNNLEG